MLPDIALMRHNPLANMFLQQGQCGHAAVTHNLFVGNDRHINQRKIAGVQFPGQRRIIKLLQPVGGVRIRAAFAGIEKYRNDRLCRINGVRSAQSCTAYSSGSQQIKLFCRG